MMISKHSDKPTKSEKTDGMESGSTKYRDRDGEDKTNSTTL